MNDTFGPMERHALERLEDEQLVVLAQNGNVQAQHTLTERYLGRIERQVTCLARTVRLSREDMEDARQEAAAFWFPKAVRAYVLERYRGPSGCRFASLQYCVITRRFCNFARGLQRRAHHCMGVGGLMDLTDHEIEGPGRPFGGGMADPSDAAERREEYELLARLVAALPETDRALLIWVAEGNSLRTWARNRAAEYKIVQRQWRRLRGGVRTRWRRTARRWRR
jgi:hypothetical protein